jgi:hypothetical protein
MQSFVYLRYMKRGPVLILFICFSMVSLMAQKPAAQPQRPRWVDCILINSSGDSVKGQVKNKKDLSAVGSLLPGHAILIRHRDGSEVITDLKTLAEIIIPGKPANNHYLVLNCNRRCPGQYNLYRVITEGACKLVYIQMPGKSGTMIINPSNHGETINTLNQQVAEEYYLYSNRALTFVHVDDALYLNSVSKTDCIQVFKSCPEIVKKLGDKKWRAVKINELVDEFNRCGKGNGDY